MPISFTFPATIAFLSFSFASTSARNAPHSSVMKQVAGGPVFIQNQRRFGSQPRGVQ